MSGDGGSFGRLGLHVGADWQVRVSTYPDRTPILDIGAGGTSLALTVRGAATGEEAVKFARALLRDVHVFTAEVERLHARTAGTGTAAGEAA